jgi:endonuclease YncB( thermonuclease family)
MSAAGLYKYRATVDRWIDADTVDLRVDLGFSVYHKLRFRLARINAPERGQEGHAPALDVAIRIAPVGAAVFVESYRGDKYGRWVGEVTSMQGVNVSSVMLTEGVAAFYQGAT